MDSGGGLKGEGVMVKRAGDGVGGGVREGWM